MVRILFASILAAAMSLAVHARETPVAERNTTVSASELPVLITEPKSATRYRLIPAGSFMMGCVPGDTACEDGEKPRHEVTIPHAFYLAETETTNEQYRRCVRAGACQPPSDLSWYDEPLRMQGEVKAPRRNFPVVFVDWNQATAFCTWAGGRLPTEAEWEHAARGGQEALQYPWGDTIAREHANFGRQVCCGGQAMGKDKWPQASPVGSFKANAFGLFDMAGNVWEWTTDAYDQYAATGALVDFGEQRQRVLRGGSWYSPPEWLRVSRRGGAVPAAASNDYGFRCARDAPQ
jgi:eukaryotic-like serine/threonine-protein kinase